MVLELNPFERETLFCLFVSKEERLVYEKWCMHESLLCKGEKRYRAKFIFICDICAYVWLNEKNEEHTTALRHKRGEVGQESRFDN